MGATGHDGRIAAALPDYDVLDELGRGAMGVVHRGRHRRLDRMVAIKELPSAFAADALVQARFLDEARLLASLDHPHVVPVYDYVERDGQCLLVMEELPGGTVWSRFVDQGYAMPEACAVVLASCAGLHHAHEHGVLHRDVKPENLMFARDGALKVTDFGIAKTLNGDVTQATADGGVLGTPAYMAPEQAAGEDVDRLADVYALGVLLFELLSGRLPHEADDVAEILAMRTGQDAPPLRSLAPAVPEPIADVAMAALARDRSARPATSEEFGVRVAEAASLAWGNSWLEGAGLAVRGAERLIDAARTTSTRGAGRAPAEPNADEAARRTGDGTGRRAAAAETVGPATRPDADEVDGPRARAGDATIAPAGEPSPVGDAATPPSRADETIAPGSMPAAAPSEPEAPAPSSTPAPPAAPPVPQPVPSADPVPPAVVRPSRREHLSGGAGRDVTPDDLVEISEITRPKPIAWWALALALAALGALAVVVGQGAGDVLRDVDDAHDAVVIQSQPLAAAAADPIELDPSAETIVVDGADGEHRIGVEFFGVPLLATGWTSADDPIEPGLLRWIVAGTFTARYETRTDEAATSTAVTRFDASSTAAPWLTVTAVAVFLGALVSIAYVESNLRVLRRGRQRMSRLVGLAITGGLGGLTISLATGLFGLGAPGREQAIACVAATCVALFGVGVFTHSIGRRRRLRERAARRRARAMSAGGGRR